MALLALALIVVALLFGAVFAIFAYRALVLLISGSLDAPFVPTPPRYADIVTTTLALAPGDVVYELGSGGGNFMAVCALRNPGSTFVGIERNPLLHLAARYKKWKYGIDNAEFRWENFFETDLSRANKVYAYLLDPTMYRLGPKFEREFKGRLASRAFPIPRRELSGVVELTDEIGAHGQHLLFVYDF